MSLQQTNTPGALTAPTEFHRFLELPPELRSEVYEHALFDLPAPNDFRLVLEMAAFEDRRLRLGRTGPPSFSGPKPGKVNTNILLTNKEVFQEARYIIIVRAKLVGIMHNLSLSSEQGQELFNILSFTHIPILDKKYYNFCVMIHESGFGLAGGHPKPRFESYADTCCF